LNPIKEAHGDEIQEAGKQYLNSLLGNAEGEDNKEGNATKTEKDKLNKKRHARYNFNTEDLHIGEETEINPKTGTITVARSAKDAFNSEFTNYKSASKAQAAGAAKQSQKKVKKN